MRKDLVVSLTKFNHSHKPSKLLYDIIPVTEYMKILQ